MLNTRTAFPLIGSYALLEENGETHLVRIQKRYGRSEAPFDQALVSFPLRPGASGNKTVALARLMNADDLTDAERAELLQLERTAGKTGKRRDRLEELRLRDIRSDMLRLKIARLPRHLREAA